MYLNKKFVLLLFLISFSVNVFSNFYFPIKWWDETVYANLGFELQKNPLDYSFHGWGDRVSVWEGKAGFRPPLLPYILALIDLISNSNQLLVNLFIPFVGAVGAAVLYFLAKELFDEKIAVYSCLLLVFLPVYVVHSGKILTDILATVLVTASFLTFWIGFEKKIMRFKYLTGFLIGVSVLAKYTSLIIIPTFFLYLILRNRNLNFLKDRCLIISFFVFLLTISPLLLYGYFSYGTPLGPFIHGWLGASFSGGIQPWYFFFAISLQMFSIVAILFLIGLYFSAKSFRKPNSLILLCWLIMFLLFLSLLSHKEDRFFLSLAPAICILAALGLEIFGKKENIAFVLVLTIMIISTFLALYLNERYYDSKPVYCFLQSMNFLKNSENDSFIFTESSPLVYYYTRRENNYYTTIDGQIKDLDNIIKTDYSNRTVYVLWTLYANPKDIRPLLRNDANFESVFICPEDGSLAQIYKHVKS